MKKKQLRKNQVNQIKLVKQFFLYEFVIFYFQKKLYFENRSRNWEANHCKRCAPRSSCNSLNTLRATDNPNFYILQRNIQQIPVS